MSVQTRHEYIWDMRFRSMIESMKLYGLTGGRAETGALHPFVAGLLLSSSIMAEIERIVPDGVHLGWGQILAEGDSLLKEIDIMAFKGKPIHHWRA
jgi:hypothetical protein